MTRVSNKCVPVSASFVQSSNARLDFDAENARYMTPVHVSKETSIA